MFQGSLTNGIQTTCKLNGIESCKSVAAKKTVINDGHMEVCKNKEDYKQLRIASLINQPKTPYEIKKKISDSR